MNDLANFYGGKRVLLTGHTGFKGTWMTILLKALGAKVCGYSLPADRGSVYERLSPAIAAHYEADIADEAKVRQTFEECRPEIVFHFASHSSLEGNERIPGRILKTNLMGVVNVLEAVRGCSSVKSVIIVTSDKCYRNLETDEAYTEKSPLGAADPYSTSKVCQELLTECYGQFFFGNGGKLCPCLATARASNVIGPGDYNLTRLVPYLLDSFVNGKEAQIRNPHAIRPWQYVLDVLQGYLLLGRKLYEACGNTLIYNGAYNFGPEGDGIAQVETVVSLLAANFDQAIWSVSGPEYLPRQEKRILKLDSTKAGELLDWHPKVGLEHMLRLTAEYVRKEKDGEEPGRLAEGLVRDYLAR